MDRCAKALELHHEGYNCAQSVAGAFADLLGLPEESVMAVPAASAAVWAAATKSSAAPSAAASWC